MQLLDVRPDHLKIVQDILKTHVPEREVWAFGSRAKWTAKEYSDLDLCVVGEEPMGLHTQGLLKEAFADSDLPWKVDVVDWATTSESFRKIIEKDKVVVWEGWTETQSIWKEQKLAELSSEVSYGYTQSASEEKIGPHFLRITDIQNGFVNWANVPYCMIETDDHKKYKLVEGDIVIARTGNSTGENFLYRGTEDTVFASYLIRFRIDSKKNDPLFVWYNLRSRKWWDFIGNAKTGSAQAGANAKILGQFIISTPPLSEQHAIAHILGTLDDKIELNRKQNETLEAMARALFKAWFVDFEPVRAKMDGRWKRGQSLPGLPAHLYDLFPDKLVDSELGEIPEGWEVSSLGEICSYINRGISPKYIDLGGVSVLNQKCIRDFSIDFSKARRHDAIQRKIDGRAVQLGDVLVNSTGVGTLGRVAQVQRLTETTIVDSHVTVVRSGARINPMYLGGFMSMKQPEIETMGEGSTGQTELSRTKLGELKILIPMNGVLNYFSQHTKTMSEIIAANKEDSETLAKLRDTLLPKLISGELRVKDAERIIGVSV